MKKFFVIFVILLVGCTHKEYIKIGYDVRVLKEEDIVGSYLSSGVLINSQEQLDKYTLNQTFNGKSMVFFSGIYDGNYFIDITNVDLDNELTEEEYDGFIFVTAKKVLSDAPSCNCLEIRGYLIELDDVYDSKKLVVELPEK